MVFAIFAALAFNLAALAHRALLRQSVLAGCNFYFISTFVTDGPFSLFPLVAFVGAGFAGVRLLQQESARRWFPLLLLGTLASFFWLKKYSFIPAALFIERPYVTIGLSYIFFRILQVMIDVGQGSLRSRIGMLEYINYVLNFTTLVSGPIQRYQEYCEMHRSPLPISWSSSGRAIERIVKGAFKILVLGGFLLSWHRESLAAVSSAHGTIDASLCALQTLTAYTFYLYCNFSGYTDIVIGIARFFGIELPENFNRPFASFNFMEFWNRWHMTLSNWLKAYVYNPVVKLLMVRYSSQRVDPYIGVFAFFLTFFLIGLWHGQTPVFALYGLLLGFGVSGNKLYQVLVGRWLGRKRFKDLAEHPLYQAIARGLTFTWFTLSLLCFWSTWTELVNIVSQLGYDGCAVVCLALFSSSTIVLAAWEFGRRAVLAITVRGKSIVLSRYFRTSWITALALVTFAVVSLLAMPAPDIIYKNF